MASQKQQPPTWQLAAALKVHGVSSIQVRSFAVGCTASNQNLVLWNRENHVRVIDDFDRLPKSQGSWH